MLNVLDLFSGIGGFSLGLERTGGFRTVAFCEIEPYCQKVLAKHWPGVPIYEDIRKLDGRDINADVITGGYPCQPFSVAGTKRGTDDPRHLWPEMLRLIESIRPRYVIAENVANHVRMGLDQVLTDLGALGYACWPFVIPAASVQAPHHRNRLWLVADSGSPGSQGRGQKHKLRQTKKERQAARALEWPPEPGVARMAHGIPGGVDRHRVKALGNSLIPQIPELIGRAILESSA